MSKRKIPTIAELTKELSDINANVEYPTEIHLQVLEGGIWRLHLPADLSKAKKFGGQWANAFIPGCHERFEPREIARDLITRIKENMWIWR